MSARDTRRLSGAEMAVANAVLVGIGGPDGEDWLQAQLLAPLALEAIEEVGFEVLPRGSQAVCDAARLLALVLECAAPDEQIIESRDGPHTTRMPCGECAPCRLDAALAEMEGP